MINLKPLIVQGLGPLGGYRMSRWLTRSTPKILMYHRFSENPEYGYVDRDMFERQVHYLRSRFNLVTLGDLLKSFYDKGSYPANAVVITVDDGYRDFYDIAYPVLRKYKAPATFFITTRFVDGDFWLWPDKIRYILQESGAVNLQKYPGMPEYNTDSLTSEDRKYLWTVIVTYLLSISENEKTSWIEQFVAGQGVVVSDCPVDKYQAVNWDQIREMDSCGIELGAHTRTHPSLGRLEETQVYDEVQGSVDDIERNLGRTPASFCYPNGQPIDYSESVKHFVKSAGCGGAVTAFYDNAMTDDVYELRRFNISEDWPFFIRTMSGIDVLAAKWLKTDNIMHQFSEENPDE